MCVSFDQLIALDLTATSKKQNLWSDNLSLTLRYRYCTYGGLQTNSGYHHFSLLTPQCNHRGTLMSCNLPAGLAAGQVDWQLGMLTGCWSGWLAAGFRWLAAGQVGWLPSRLTGSRVQMTLGNLTKGRPWKGDWQDVCSTVKTGLVKSKSWGLHEED